MTLSISPNLPPGSSFSASAAATQQPNATTQPAAVSGVQSSLGEINHLLAIVRGLVVDASTAGGAEAANAATQAQIMSALNTISTIVSTAPTYNSTPLLTLDQSFGPATTLTISGEGAAALGNSLANSPASAGTAAVASGATQPGVTSLTIGPIDLSNTQSARTSLTMLDLAIANVASMRAQFSSYDENAQPQTGQESQAA